MKKRTRNATILMLMVMLLSTFMSFASMAAVNYPSDVRIQRLEVYPANVNTKKVYSDSYMYSNGTVNQSVTIKLTSRVRDYYKNNNCNGFYVKLYAANAYQALRYEAYDNGSIVNKGYCTTIPNYAQEIDFYVTADNTMYNSSDGKYYTYGSWKTIFYGWTNGFPLRGDIMIPID